MNKRILISSMFFLLLNGCGGSGSNKSSLNNTTSVSNNTTSVSNNTEYSLSLHLETQTILVNEALLVSAKHNLPNNITYKWTLTGPNNKTEIAPKEQCQQQCTLYPNLLGEYTLVVEADNQTNKLTKKLNFTVKNASTEQLKAIISGPKEVYKGTTVTLNANKSEFIPDTTITWNLESKPSDSNAKLNSSNLSETRFQTDKIGIYKISLNLKAGQRTSNQYFEVKAVSRSENVAPVADISVSSETINTNTEINLSGQNSYDANNDKLSYSWSVSGAPNNAQYTLLSQRDVEAKFKAQDPGSYQVSLTVSDGQAQHSTTKQLQVTTQNVPPIAFIHAYNNAEQGDTINYQAQTLKSKEGRDLKYTWSLVSKPANSETSFTNSDSDYTTLYADKSGEYISELYITEGDQTSSAARHILKVQQNHPPYISGPLSTSVKVGETVTIKIEGTDPENDELTYSWEITSKPDNANFTLEHNNTNTASFITDTEDWYILEIYAHDGFQSSLQPWSILIQVDD